MSETYSTLSVIQELEEMTNITNESYVFEENQEKMFYGLEFERFNLFYRPIHGYLSLAVCVFGIIANVLNIIVLTRSVHLFVNVLESNS